MASLLLDRKLFSLMAEEIIGYLPQFEPYSSDYQMVLYACKDFKEWMRWQLDVETFRVVNGRIERFLESDPEAFNFLLNCWVGLWVAKWKERVEVLSTLPKLPTEVLKHINDARKFYRIMKYRKELKHLVIKKLLRQGEICMVNFITEQLITDEIARYSIGSNSAQEIEKIFPIDILNHVSSRISKLSMEKGPLIYLSIKPHPI
jgi:hypothetical protein